MIGTQPGSSQGWGTGPFVPRGGGEDRVSAGIALRVLGTCEQVVESERLGVRVVMRVVCEDEEKRERRETSMGRRDILPSEELRMLCSTVQVVFWGEGGLDLVWIRQHHE